MDCLVLILGLIATIGGALSLGANGVTFLNTFSVVGGTLLILVGVGST